MIRRNGIVRVPKLWVEAAVEAFGALKKQSGNASLVLPLPVKALPYPKIREALKTLYPEKFIPLTVMISAGAGLSGAKGSASPKKDGGYKIILSFMLKGADAVSTILHELRHVVQYLGDEVVKTKSGTFGRPTKASTASLRARKKAIKAGQVKASHKHAAYFTSASEWQPWIGSTSDKIVGEILDGKLSKTADVNAAIRTGILSSTFYTETDPATRKELMRQVYTEVVRQLKGYTDIVPAKHPTQAAHIKKVAQGAALSHAMGKHLQETFQKYGLPFSTMGVTFEGKLTPASGPFTVYVKIENASTAIVKETTYAGKDSKGRDKLAVPAADKDAALLAAEQFAMLAKAGSTLYGGMIYAVRIAHGGKESEVYVAGEKSNPRRTRRAPRRRTR
jgi:hypothetical protein